MAPANPAGEVAARPSAAACGKAAMAPLLLVAPCVLTLAFCNSPTPIRAKAAELSADSSCLIYADASANEVTASPCVTSPAAPVARFGVLELPVVASVVHVRCVAEVIIARIGGRYGP
jgi:hypothetical protein